MPRRPLLLALLMPVTVLAACGGDAPRPAAGAAADSDRPTVVVTTSILGAIVSDLVGDAAAVRVLVPNGQDPHDVSPSAQDVAALRAATLVVANGMGMEGQLARAVDDAAAAGVAVFRATDHVTLRDRAPAGHEHEGGGGEAEDADHADHADHAGEDEDRDPHIWTDPVTVAAFVGPLASRAGAALDVDLSAAAARVDAELAAVDGSVRSIMAALPRGRCKLVTGHDSLGYFADRYGCEVVGAVIPSLSSTAEASARDLARLREAVEHEDVAVVFTEVGTPRQVAEQVAREAGVPVVELPSHALPAGGGYAEYLEDLARRIVAGLTGDVP